MFKSNMFEKNLKTEPVLDQGSKIIIGSNKSIKGNSNQSQKVDINVLKARIQSKQNTENKKNIIIFVTTLLILGVLGVYFSV